MKTVSAQLEECVAVAKQLPPFDSELAGAVSCVLAEDIRATVDVPAADLATTDGYAVQAADVSTGSAEIPVRLPVVGEVFASSPKVEGHVANTAMRVASGGRIPVGADAIVPLTGTDEGLAEVTISHPVHPGDNVRAKGSDVLAGKVVVQAGTRLGARHIALLAAVGRDRVVVHPVPRVVVMSIGDELVFPGAPLGPGKVYDSNSHALAAAVESTGAVAYRVSAVSDEKNILRNTLEDQLVRADVVITTGGLSYGGGDTVKEVLSPLGSVRFDNVAMKPGGQIGVGTVGDDNTIIFCLPGDPYAAMVAFEVFVRPALRNMAGYSQVEARTIIAHAARAIDSQIDRCDYLPAHVYGSPRQGYEFEPLARADDRNLTSLVEANGLVIIPEDKASVSAGAFASCIIFKS